MMLTNLFLSLQFSGTGRHGGHHEDPSEPSKKRLFPKMPFHTRKQKEDKAERRRSTTVDEDSKSQTGIVLDSGDRTRKGSPQHRRENGNAQMMDSLNQELNSCLTNAPDGQVVMNAVPESYPTGTANRVALKPPKQRRNRKAKEPRGRKVSVEDDEAPQSTPQSIPRSNSNLSVDRKPLHPVDYHRHQEVSSNNDRPDRTIDGKQALRPPPRVDRLHVAHAATKALDVISKEPLSKQSSLKNDPDSVSQHGMDDSDSSSGRERPMTPKGYREKTKTIQRPKIPPPAPPPVSSHGDTSPTSPHPPAAVKPAFTLPRSVPHGAKPPITSPKPTITSKPDFSGQKPPPPAKPPTLDTRRTSMRRQVAVDADSVGYVTKTSLLELAAAFEKSVRTVLHDGNFSHCPDLCIDVEVFHNACKKYVDSVSVRVKFSLREHLTKLEVDVGTLKRKCSSGSNEQLEVIICDLQTKVNTIKTLIQRA